MYVEQPDRGGTVRFKRFWRTKRTLKWRENESSHQRLKVEKVAGSFLGIWNPRPRIYSGTFGVQATMEDKRNRERRGIALSRAGPGRGFSVDLSRCAAGFAVAGYVKNLADGQVLVVVEGEPDRLDRFLAAVDDEMSRNIRRSRSRLREPLANFEEHPLLIPLCDGLCVPRRAIQSACFSDEPNLDFPRKKPSPKCRFTGTRDSFRSGQDRMLVGAICVRACRCGTRIPFELIAVR